MTSNIIPYANGVLNLGSNNKRFGELWLVGQTIYLGNIALQDNNGKLATLAIDASGAIIGSAIELASNIYIDGRLATKANISDLTLEIDGDGGTSNVVNLYNDTLSFTGTAPGSYVSVAAGGLVTIVNTGVTGITGTANEVEVNAATGNITIGLPNNVTISNDLSVLGNLNVSGNVVTIGVDSLRVNDPLIHLANNNTTSDLVDIGFEGHYFDATFGQRHAGLFRDASDGGKFKLFANVSVELENATTVNTDPAIGYTVATLNAKLDGPSANVLNANVSTLLEAQALQLQTALAVVYGGTGRATLTANAVIAGDGTNQVRLVTGSSGQVLQVDAAGQLVFGGIDGGTY